MNTIADASLQDLDAAIAAVSRKEYLPHGLVTLVAEVQALHINALAEAQVVLPPEGDFAQPDLRAQGAPLLGRANFPLDLDQAKKLFSELLTLMDKMAQPLPESSAVLTTALSTNVFSLDQAFDAYLANNLEYFEDLADYTPKAPSLFRFLIQASASPSIVAAAQALSQHISDKVWNWGHCPLCASLPFMADLKDKEGRRHLSCSFCHTQYRVKRISCPYCGEEDFEKLSFYTAKEEPGFRVDVCRSCRNYIKTTDFRQMDRKSSPLIDDLDSVVMDILAADKGYSRPTLSGWGF
ncbi:MAG: formate dehydrogenase accessory protein FdhE [Desulfovibrio sp.]|nr:MAG: formate dehydrogenase accessory protein FdhE [Desulfovibrio sp.]